MRYNICDLSHVKVEGLVVLGLVVLLMRQLVLWLVLLVDGGDTFYYGDILGLGGTLGLPKLSLLVCLRCITHSMS